MINDALISHSFILIKDFKRACFLKSQTIADQSSEADTRFNPLVLNSKLATQSKCQFLILVLLIVVSKAEEEISSLKILLLKSHMYFPILKSQSTT